MILPQEIIRKKRDGSVLTSEEIEAFFGGFIQGEVADYQVSAMLMSIFFQGMDRFESASLTKVMRDSGLKLSWNFPKELIVDKHSTGGIGDKTSIVILPLAVLSGLKVPMIAGRGLGHTGGTLDKLEAVGFKVFQEATAVRRQVESLGGIFMGQTEALVPLDRRLYALRDVTSTVESVPLIVGSILSKKLAAGLGGLVMDVKFGSGAFMQEYGQAMNLAKALVDVASQCDLKIRCILTSMNQPLGAYAGNALEIFECLELLQGRGPSDARELTLELTTEMVHLAFPSRDTGSIRRQLEGFLADGSAYELFCKIAAAQGADTSAFKRPQQFLEAPVKLEVPADISKGAFVSAIDTRKLGLAIIELGGGRRLVTDKIDPLVGLSGMRHLGEKMNAKEPLAVVHARNLEQAKSAVKLISEAYQLASQGLKDTLIRERV